MIHYFWYVTPSDAMKAVYLLDVQEFWGLGRAVAQARAVYLRFTVLLQNCIEGDSSNAAVARSDECTKQRLRDPEFQNEMNKLSFFLLDAQANVIFICDKYTLKQISQSDTDYYSHEGVGTISTVVARTASYSISLDPYVWEKNSLGYGFQPDPNNLRVLLPIEKQAELSNTPADWKSYRRWKNAIKSEDLDKKFEKTQ